MNASYRYHARLWWLLVLLAGMMPGLVNAAPTFVGAGIYHGIQHGEYLEWLVGKADLSVNARFQYSVASPGQDYEFTNVGAGYFQIRNMTWNGGTYCLAKNAGDTYLIWVTCPSALAPNTAAQFDMVATLYTTGCSPAAGKLGMFMRPVSAHGNCVTQNTNISGGDTDAFANACDDPNNVCSPLNLMFKDGGTATLGNPLHLLLTQANAGTVLNDNATPKVITITSCNNAAVGTCIKTTSDNQTVTVSIQSGIGTLNAAAPNTSITVLLSAGVGSFTVKSGTAGVVQLAVVPAYNAAQATTGTCNRNGALTSETTWTTTNADCSVIFGTPSGPVIFRKELF